MDSSALFLLAADAILLLHVLFVAFVVTGLVLILIGKVRAWFWVRNPWFRLAHLIAIGVVIVQSWVEAVCPLTTLETAGFWSSRDHLLNLCAKTLRNCMERASVRSMDLNQSRSLRKNLQNSYH